MTSETWMSEVLALYPRKIRQEYKVLVSYSVVKGTTRRRPGQLKTGQVSAFAKDLHTTELER